MGPIFMALLLIAGWGAFAYSARRRWRLMNVGTPENRCDRPGERIAATVRYAFAQMRMRRYPVAGAAHMLIFLGFGVLLLRTLILWGRGFDADFSFWLFGPDQILGKIYSPIKDLFALLVIAGVLVFVYFRVVKKLPRMTLSTEGLVILGIILVMMISDIFYDGASLVLAARAATADGADPAYAFHGVEPAGSIAQYVVALLPDGAVKVVQHFGFWAHSALVLIFLNILPYSKHFHIITAVPNVYTQNLNPAGRLAPIADIDGRLERGETLGIKRIDQFSWKSILDFYTCTECGRCSDHCPATKTGKKLSPKHFTMDLRNFLYEHEDALVASARREPRPPDDDAPETPAVETSAATDGANGHGPHLKDLVEGVIDPEVLWACTTCRACEQECPVFISYVDKIVDMRRYLVMERSEFPGELQQTFQMLESTANPWGFPAEDRTKWTEGLDVPTLADKPDAEYLFWSGCMPSYDERAKKVTRATIELMQKAGVSFAILGAEEQCTGDPARRAGYEYLYQMMAKTNVEVMNGYGVDKKKIVTSCPHCFNTIKNEYPDFGGKYEVVHHTQLLDDLVRRGKLKPTQAVDQKVAYHDSCYLGRHNGEYDAPRNVLSSIPGLTILEPVQTRDRGMCCGAGGAQMFKEEEHGTKRVNEERTDQLLATSPTAVASNCPFCMRMVADGLAGKEREDVQQLDVAELLHQAVMGNAETRKHGNAETV